MDICWGYSSPFSFALAWPRPEVEVFLDTGGPRIWLPPFFWGVNRFGVRSEYLKKPVGSNIYIYTYIYIYIYLIIPKYLLYNYIHIFYTYYLKSSGSSLHIFDILGHVPFLGKRIQGEVWECPCEDSCSWSGCNVLHSSSYVPDSEAFTFLQASWPLVPSNPYSPPARWGLLDFIRVVLLLLLG